MEYEADTRFCRAALRCRFVQASAIDRAAQVQRREKRAGLAPRAIESILVAGGDLSEERARLVRAANGLIRRSEAQARVLGPYRILGKIARGGMGSVLRGVDRRNGKAAAVKVLHRRDHPISRHRFFREAQAVLSLSHPNIVKGIEIGEADETTYFAMEYIHGETLGERVKRKGPLQEEEALGIVVQVARALECARRARIVHRDVKPDNILITPEGVAKLCDLGLARPIFRESTVTEEGITLGTPTYISPEQARGASDLDSRSDIYSLGITLYHALVGRPPFDGCSAGVVISRHLTEEVPSPRAKRPDISPATDAIVRRMTAKKRSDRYPTPLHLEGDLLGAIQGVSGGAPRTEAAAATALGA